MLTLAQHVWQRWKLRPPFLPPFADLPPAASRLELLEEGFLEARTGVRPRGVARSVLVPGRFPWCLPDERFGEGPGFGLGAGVMDSELERPISSGLRLWVPAGAAALAVARVAPAALGGGGDSSTTSS